MNMRMSMRMRTRNTKAQRIGRHARTVGVFLAVFAAGIVVASVVPGALSAVFAPSPSAASTALAPHPTAAVAPTATPSGPFVSPYWRILRMYRGTGSLTTEDIPVPATGQWAIFWQCQAPSAASGGLTQTLFTVSVYDPATGGALDLDAVATACGQTLQHGVDVEHNVSGAGSDVYLHISAAGPWALAVEAAR